LTDTAQLRALVVGGGIGGLATAHALAGLGVDSIVFERVDDVRKIQLGGGFHMWTNAVRALARLGLYDEVQAIGAPLTETRFFTSKGKSIARWPVGEIAEANHVTDVGISRQDLQALLVETVGRDRIRLGATVTGFAQDDDGVTVTLKDGSTERGDLLIGADGLRSTIRGQLHGDGPPRYAGYTQWQSLIPDPGHEWLPAGTERVLFGPGSRAVLHHVGGGRLFWAAVIYGDEAGPEASAGPELLLERFQGWPEPILAAITATAPERIARLQIYDRRPILRWGEGRVTLVGDAAHPMTTNLSQGACQVLEDAAVLARCLTEEDGVEASLGRYERVRTRRTAPLVKESRRAADMGAWRRAPVCAVRARVFGIALSGPALKSHRRFVAEPL
jgi:2-polyprenyl-6-methoxyphenol hydroxylase-like FAD-dependent oxidoreductase